jgi:hypothetical protein
MPPRLKRDYLHSCFDVYLKEQADLRFREIRAQLDYDASLGDTPLLEWVHHTIVNPSPIAIAVFQHFIWLVKRRMYELPIKQEMMINFVGDQGAGKTFTTRKLCKPLHSLYSERTLTDTLDERSQHQLSITYGNLFEELKGAAKADIDHLKALMSGERLTWRKLGHNQHISSWQNTTFIATSNFSLAEHLYDPTGMRRFYEMEFVKAVDRDWLSKADPVLVWKSVDHLAPCYLEPFADELAQKQDQLRQQTSVELYFHYNMYEMSEDAPSSKLADVYKHYSEFCKEMNMQPYALAKFSTKVRQEVFPELQVAHKRDGNYINLKRVLFSSTQKELI